MTAAPVVHPTVSAVVVTYNRKALLLRTVRALLEQSLPPQAIVIVDNASIDGTEVALREAGWIKDVPAAGQTTSHTASDHPGTAFHYVRMARNTGSAGGFHAGIAEALSLNTTHVWLMDDDGQPECGCLASLVPHCTRFDAIGSAVVREDDPSRLAWQLRKFQTVGRPQLRAYISSMDELRALAIGGVYPGTANFFNSVLVSTAAIQRAGLPIAELFIWGDEVEFYYRLLASGARIGVAPDSVYRHPPANGRSTALKHYYACRNTFFIHRRYGKATYGLIGMLLYLPYISLKLALRSPDRSFRYLAATSLACLRAWGGTLIPFESSGALKTAAPKN